MGGVAYIPCRGNQTNSARRLSAIRRTVESMGRMGLPMTHLHCTITGCEWRSLKGPLESVIASYLSHCIRDHWEILQYAHDNPETLDLIERLTI